MEVNVQRTGGYRRYVPNVHTSGGDYVEITIPDDGGEIVLPETVSENTSDYIEIPVQFDPVYAGKIDGKERLVYNPSIMKTGTEYKVSWNGEHFLLVKDGDGQVNIYKFHPGP